MRRKPCPVTGGDASVQQDLASQQQELVYDFPAMGLKARFERQTGKEQQLELGGGGCQTTAVTSYIQAQDLAVDHRTSRKPKTASTKSNIGCTGGSASDYSGQAKLF